MARHLSLRAELNELRDELSRLREAQAGAAGAAPQADAVPKDIKDLLALAQTLMDEAEETVSDHPVASVAAALALGLVIGRLTCR